MHIFVNGKISLSPFLGQEGCTEFGEQVSRCVHEKQPSKRESDRCLVLIWVKTQEAPQGSLREAHELSPH